MGGNPQTLTFIISTGPTDSIFTFPCALGATVGKAFRPAVRRRSKWRSSPSLSVSKACAGVDKSAAAPMAASAVNFILANRLRMLLTFFILYVLILSAKTQPIGGSCRRTDGLQSMYNGIALLEFQIWRKILNESSSPKLARF